MEMLYGAYGLRLVSSFPLPGMEAATQAFADLPLLALTLRDPDELERAWSGASGPAEWRGRQGDGRDLVIERGADGDVLFHYGELARFRLDARVQRLECAPSRKGLDWQRALIGKVIPSVSVMLGYEGLHAAAVDAPDGVVAIMGASGAGKSTLALELLRRGWPLFCDDVLALSRADGLVVAHPGTPHMNLDQSFPGAIDSRKLGDTIGILAGERWLVAANSTGETRSVRMLCLLERRAGLSLGIHSLAESPLALAPYMLGLSIDPERQRSRFELYAGLVETSMLVSLTAGLEHRPWELAERLEQALACKPEPLAEVLA
jgi:hypothetical protein